ncbi:Ankyrin repeat and protein kinase domain-containing protein 1 [Hondaea fermentalgiana]|uniref:Ankyrin repeat and protein kinase domain-containing protein 1 n=1 Tax=Hondaea fermentalgiana TaxID=2315210 RepID=A0A2R5GNP1_9STRA|nr:Ankyrin repeat and protein kinase domain-containing protein 1 [Hondaea fermentalgiana]|eukprot:GBG31919.1 Ankyrin repeat and protein kinase domain-containing protein 1 [Hondaea fermentalgiana]
MVSMFNLIRDGDVAGVQRAVQDEPSLLNEAVTTSKSTPLMWTLCEESGGQPVIARWLIERGANLDLQNNNGDTALMLACRYEQPDTAQLLAERGANLDLQNNNEDTALMLACRFEQPDTAQSLTERGANLDLQNNNGDTALMLACYHGQPDTAQLLIKRNANLDLLNDDENTALMLACWRGQPKTAQLLIERGANLDLQNGIGWTALMFASRRQLDLQLPDGWTALMLACRYDQPDTAQLLTERGTNLDLQNDDKNTALMLACRYKQPETAQLLIERGVNLDLQLHNGWTALMFACRYDQPDTAQLLTEHGANLDLQNDDKSTALMFACRYKQPETAQLLIERGANLDLQDNNGGTALMFTCEHSQSETAQLLIDSGANLDLQNDDRNTALMLACRYKQPETVQLLIEGGAKLDLQNNKRWTALMFACRYKQPETAQLLIERGAKLELQNNKRWTALMFACRYGQPKAAQLLIERGVNLDLQNNKGVTALMFACEHGQPETAHLLIDSGANLNLQDNDRWAALSLACRNDQPGTAQLLIERGANLYLQEKEGWTALMLACRFDQPGTAQLLLDDERGANLDLQANDGWTALMLACQEPAESHHTEKGLLRCLKLCYVAGADLHLKNKKGRDALANAKYYSRADAVAFLEFVTMLEGTRDQQQQQQQQQNTVPLPSRTQEMVPHIDRRDIFASDEHQRSTDNRKELPTLLSFLQSLPLAQLQIKTLREMVVELLDERVQTMNEARRLSFTRIAQLGIASVQGRELFVEAFGASERHSGLEALAATVAFARELRDNGKPVFHKWLRPALTQHLVLSRTLEALMNFDKDQANIREKAAEFQELQAAMAAAPTNAAKRDASRKSLIDSTREVLADDIKGLIDELRRSSEVKRITVMDKMSRAENTIEYLQSLLSSLEPGLKAPVTDRVELLVKNLRDSRKKRKRIARDLEDATENADHGDVNAQTRLPELERELAKIGSVYRQGSCLIKERAHVLHHAETHYPELLQDQEWLDRIGISNGVPLELSKAGLCPSHVERESFTTLTELASKPGKLVQKVRSPDGRELALRTYHLTDEEWSSRFYRQVIALAKMRSAYLVRIESTFMQDVRYGCVVMPYYSGGDLAAWMRDNADADVTTRRRIAACLLSGLHDLHSQGFVHCDIKPANVFLDPDHLPVLDFDGAQAHDKALTQQAVIKYVAPEIRNGNVDKVEPAVDMFSIGVVLAELFDGSEASDAIQVLVASLQSANPAQRPSALEALRHEAFQIEPMKRVSCAICLDVYPISEGVSCDDGHFTCDNCLRMSVRAATQVQSHVKILRNGSMCCVAPNCDLVISGRAIASAVPEADFAVLLNVVREQFERDVAAEQDRQLRDRVDAALREHGVNPTTQNHIHDIHNEILNAHYFEATEMLLAIIRKCSTRPIFCLMIYADQSRMFRLRDPLAFL